MSPMTMASVLRTALAHGRTPAEALADHGESGIDVEISHVRAATSTSDAAFKIHTSDGDFVVIVRSA